MSSHVKVVALTVGLLFATMARTYAVSTTGGAQIPIEDGSQHECIDVSNNLVSMTLFEIQLQRSQSWWQSLISKRAAMGVKWDVTIQNESGQSFDFPRIKQLAVPPQEADIALLPMTLSIMSKYPLSGPGNDQNVNVTLDLYLLTVNKKSLAFNDLSAMINFSSSLPLPVNPYITGMDYFGKFVQQMVAQDINNGLSPYPDASFSFGLATNEVQSKDCPPFTLEAGVQAVVWDYDGTPNSHMIAVEDSSKYCYWDDSGSDRIVFASKPPNGICSPTEASNARDLDNPLVAFVVSPWPTGTAMYPAAPTSVTGNKPTPVKTTLLPGAINSYADMTKNSLASNPLVGWKAEEQISRQKVLSLYKALTTKNEWSKPTKLAVSHATPFDAATALALKRCTIVGIAPHDCY